MITMDVKGINWVGCVYEKFESMCLEVEENMYQDTVKFVEDQVQTVGESVKKFYADIMQDLLCDSSLDGDNISACGFPIEHYSDVDNSKKSKIRKTKEHVRVGVEEVNGDSEVISVVEKDVEHTGLFHRQRVYDSCTRSSGDCAKVACSDLYSRQDHGMRSYNNKNLVVKQTPIKDRLPGANTAVGKDFNRVSLSCSEFSNENHDASCDQPDEVITPTVEGMRCDSMRERCVVANASQCTDDVSINCQSSDLIVLDKSDGKRWNELLESSIGGLSAESNGGSNNSSVHGTEISQQSDKAKLEETCVMVSGEELHFVHHMVANCKPYKMLDFEMETWSLPNWLKLDNLIFESDSQELVAALNNRIEKGNWRIYPFLSEFHRLKGLLSSVCWSWISREANRAADVAAKLAKSRLCNEIWVNRPPTSSVFV